MNILDVRSILKDKACPRCGAGDLDRQKIRPTPYIKNWGRGKYKEIKWAAISCPSCGAELSLKEILGPSVSL